MKTLVTPMLLVATTFSSSVIAQSAPSVWDYFTSLTVEENGIGARPAGSDKERVAAKWIEQQWQSLGFDVEKQSFDFELRGNTLTSQNLIIDIKGERPEIIIVGAHYDSTGEKFGSLGAIDNASGMAALLALSAKIAKKPLPYSVRLIAFGAEEVGLQGAKAYVKHEFDDRDKAIAMINLDTIIGGDKLYVHSAHTTPYDCKSVPNVTFNSETVVRDALRSVSVKHFGAEAHLLHPANDEYPEGVTGSWSDHAPFACAGVPIAYLEATNFDIDGRQGKDGYSQTTTPELWNCYDKQQSSACERKKEFKWGMIWHTQFDRVDALQAVMPGRLTKQLSQNVKVLTEFVENADTYLN